MFNKKKCLSKTYPLWLAIISVLALFNHLAFAQVNDDVKQKSAVEPPELERIEIKGKQTKFAELKDSAKAVDLIDTSWAKNLTADIGEVMSRVPGVSVRRSGGLGSSSRFSLNGLTGDQVRFFVDGVPLEMSGYISGISNIPVNLVEHIEIYQGVVPLEFGADALGGAVNLVSNQLSDTNGSISHQMGDFGTRRTSLSLNHVSDNGFFARINAYSDAADNDYEIEVENNGELTTVKRFHDNYAAQGLFLNFGLANKNWADLLQVSLFNSEYAQDIQHNVNMTVPYGEVTYDLKTKGINIRYEHDFSDLLALKTVFGLSERESHFFDVSPHVYDWSGEALNVFSNPGEINDEANGIINSTDYFARINIDFLISPEQSIKLLFAPTLHERTGDNLLLSEGQFDADSAERKLFTFVAGAEHSINFMKDSLQNIFFIKYYHLDIQAQTTLTSFETFYDNERTEDKVGWGNAMRYNINDWSFLKVSFENATRMPSSNEIFGKEPSQPNLELLPEESQNYNLSYSIEALKTPVGFVRANTNLFIRDIDNLVRFVPAGRGGSYENLLKAKSEGIQGAMGWTSHEAFAELDFNLTYIDFRNVTSGNLGSGSRIPNEPYLYSNLAIKLNWDNVISGFDLLSLSWHSRFVEEFSLIYDNLNALNKEREIVPSQLTHAIALTYSTDIYGSSITFSAEIQNLTDEKVYDFYGVQRPGRALNAKVIYEF